MKKKFLKFLALFIIIFILVGCGKKEKEKISLEVNWGAHIHTDTFKNLVKKFEEENPQIEVKVVNVAWVTDDALTYYTTQFMAGQVVPDVLLIDVIWPPLFAKNGWLYPLNKYFPKKEQKKFVPSWIKSATIDGNIYAVPLYPTTGNLFYRKDVLDFYNFSPPETWDELIRISKIILTEVKNGAYKGPKPAPLYGYLFQGAQYEGLVCNYLEFLYSAGGYLIKDKKCGLDEKPALLALNKMEQLITSGVSPAGVVSDKEEDGRAVFQEGKAIFHRNWGYAYKSSLTEESPIKGKVGIAPLPHFPGQKSVAILGGWGFAINSNSKNKDAAFKFIKFITNYNSQFLMAKDMLREPARLALYEDANLLKLFPHYKDMYRVIQTSFPRPPLSNYAEISNILSEYLHGALTNKLDNQKALLLADKEIENIL